MLSWVQSSYNNYWESQSYSGENEGNSEQAKVLCGQEEEAFRIWSWGSCVPPSNTDGRNTKGYQIKKVNSEVCCALSDTEKDWCCSLWNCPATALGESACVSRVSIAKIHSRSIPRTRVRWYSYQGRVDGERWTGADPWLASEKAARKWNKDIEGPLGCNHSGDDLGDGG